jgi:16S rRNA (guanine966-N2)-methyltransferase
MRVVAGSAGGRRLVAPAGTTTRPTSDRVREATFNALGSLGLVADATVLDLFAGSGALGIEALSRGAASATFVDRDRAAIDAVRANLETCDLVDQSDVVQSDATRFLDSAVAGGRSWTLALVDPPYGDWEWDALLAGLPAAVAVLEAGREVPTPAGWEQLRSKRYGSTYVTIVRKVSHATERR